MFSKLSMAALLLTFSSLSYGHIADTSKPKLTGNWLMVKHLITDGGKTTNELGNDQAYSFSFRADGKYSVTYDNKKTASTTTYIGKWKLSNAGKTLLLYDNSLPSDPKQLVGDRSLPVIKLTATEFVTKELLFAMDMKGTSYYKRQ